MRDDEGDRGQAAGPASWGYVGAHFITLVSREGRLLFGRVADGQVVLSQAGQIVADEWHRLHGLAPGDLVVMPNHVHGIVWLARMKGKRGRQRSDAAVLGAAVARFKAAVNRRVRALPGAGEGSFWQPGYRDLGIEDTHELAAIRRLIRENPARWAEDVENPERLVTGRA